MPVIDRIATYQADKKAAKARYEAEVALLDRAHASLGAGDVAEQLGALAGQHVLRADLVALVDLRVDRLAQEVGLPPQSRP